MEQQNTFTGGVKEAIAKGLLFLHKEVCGPPYSNFSHAQQPLKTRYGYIQSHDAAASNKNEKKLSRLNVFTTNKMVAKPQVHAAKYQNTSCSTKPAPLSVVTPQ